MARTTQNTKALGQTSVRGKPHHLILSYLRLEAFKPLSLALADITNPWPTGHAHHKIAINSVPQENANLKHQEFFSLFLYGYFFLCVCMFCFWWVFVYFVCVCMYDLVVEFSKVNFVDGSVIKSACSC